MKKLLSLICLLLIPSVLYGSGFLIGSGASGGGSVTVSFIAYASVSGYSASQSCAMPTGTTDSDLMVAFPTSDTASAGSAPAGWTAIDSETCGDPENMWSGSWYRVASSDSGPFVFTMNEDDGGVFILTFRKSGGSWTAPTTAGYHSINSEVSATSTVSSVTANTGDAIAVLYSNDGNHSVDTPPSGMTATTLLRPSSAFSLTAYHEEDLSSGSQTPALVWAASDEAQAVAVIVHAE